MKTVMNHIKKYDLHVHSYYSKCSIIKPVDILKRAKEKGLNGIAITDHDTLKAYPILKKLNKDKDFEIIPGEEIHTNHGHLLGLYLTKEIVSRDLFEAIDEIHAQGGIVIVPHPFTVAFHSFTYPLSKLKSKIDAVEAFNSRNFQHYNNIAKTEISRLGFSQVGSSDAHIPQDIGNGYTLFIGDLRTALKNKKTQIGGTTKYAIVSNLSATLNSRIIYYIRGPRK
jgi:predicted metal-dependent phosphoesterase TrpH